MDGKKSTLLSLLTLYVAVYVKIVSYLYYELQK